jgi:hypothetical protein
VLPQEAPGQDRSACELTSTLGQGYDPLRLREEPFGWGKTIGGLARPMLLGVKKLRFKFTLTMTGYNLIRLPKLIEATA